MHQVLCHHPLILSDTNRLAVAPPLPQLTMLQPPQRHHPFQKNLLAVVTIFLNVPEAIACAKARLDGMKTIVGLLRRALSSSPDFLSSREAHDAVLLVLTAQERSRIPLEKWVVEYRIAQAYEEYPVQELDVRAFTEMTLCEHAMRKKEDVTASENRTFRDLMAYYAGESIFLSFPDALLAQVDAFVAAIAPHYLFALQQFCSLQLRFDTKLLSDSQRQELRELIKKNFAQYANDEHFDTMRRCHKFMAEHAPPACSDVVAPKDLIAPMDRDPATNEEVFAEYIAARDQMLRAQRTAVSASAAAASASAAAEEEEILAGPVIPVRPQPVVVQMEQRTALSYFFHRIMQRLLEMFFVLRLLIMSD